MKYRHKQTGEVVELAIGLAEYTLYDGTTSTMPAYVPLPIKKEGPLFYSEKDFHANYEPLEEGGTDE